MKKLTYLILSISLISFFACAGDSHEGHDHEGGNHDDAASEVNEHEGHDHAAMEEAAGEQEFKPASEEARVFFVNLNPGEVVTSPVKIEMGAEGINIHPAGELLEGTGHHHIIIDEGPVPMNEVVPADEHHIHFGGGQTETEIELNPGDHILTLQLADGLHRSYGEPLSATIQIVVSE